MVVRVSIHMVKYTGSATDQCNCVQLNCFSFLAGRRLFDWLIDFTTLGTRKRERERDMPDMGYYNGSPVLQLQSVLFSSLFTSNCGSRAQAQANKMRMTDDTNNGTVGTCSHCFKLSEVCTCVSVYVFNSQATKLVQGVINRCCRKWSNGTEGKHEKWIASEAVVTHIKCRCPRSGRNYYPHTGCVQVSYNSIASEQGTLYLHQQWPKDGKTQWVEKSDNWPYFARVILNNWLWQQRNNFFTQADTQISFCWCAVTWFTQV